ncbi:MAG: tRNA (5-methylaminomethyl-2-thiouridine)(34)-methyltransferase MnmD [Flaviramulus sp.]|nr:tRNA (5-methylaminomethyl-2-thiouridine)(34)-methyltransferase MnmD [Flaviramulus sp.]NNC50778.1 tRNA (5-methylaminomethyl-2-thiouridine)(34)-methyltransferase MnmD [Flaviramulus sp.]
MKREIIITADGSTSIHLPDLDEQYHSKHGAIQEAYHVFIHNGLDHFVEVNSNSNLNISILEIGFGTGLNAFITLLEAEKRQIEINYTGVEAYPVLMEEINQLNYSDQLNQKDLLFKKLHEVSWNEMHNISSYFKLEKQKLLFHEINETNAYAIIYFDAFGARVQPDLWTESVFKNMFSALKPNGVLVTYSAKGSVRRAMEAVGFTVERLPGPPGKREMLRALKS